MQRQGVFFVGEFGAVLRRTPLLKGIDSGDLEKMLGCLGAWEADVNQGEKALTMGDAPDHIGILLMGELQIVREDENGGRALLTTLWPGDYYGEALACAGVMHSPVSVEAVAASRVLKVPNHRLMEPCANACAFHRQLIRNLASIIAKKNLMLQKRMEILEKKSIRDRVMLFLSGQMREAGKGFSLAMSRGEMADYLAVDRSALSRELGRLRDEGVLAFDGNRFVVLKL